MVGSDPRVARLQRGTRICPWRPSGRHDRTGRASIYRWLQPPDRSKSQAAIRGPSRARLRGPAGTQVIDDGGGARQRRCDCPGDRAGPLGSSVVRRVQVPRFVPEPIRELRPMPRPERPGPLDLVRPVNDRGVVRTAASWPPIDGPSANQNQVRRLVRFSLADRPGDRDGRRSEVSIGGGTSTARPRFRACARASRRPDGDP